MTRGEAEEAKQREKEALDAEVSGCQLAMGVDVCPKCPRYFECNLALRAKRWLAAKAQEDGEGHGEGKSDSESESTKRGGEAGSGERRGTNRGGVGYYNVAYRGPIPGIDTKHEP